MKRRLMSAGWVGRERALMASEAPVQQEETGTRRPRWTGSTPTWTPALPKGARRLGLVKEHWDVAVVGLGWGDWSTRLRP